MKPRQALDEAGAETKVVSPKDDKVRKEVYGLARVDEC